MAKFIHSIIVPNQAISADGLATYDLPVNPLSALLIHVSPLNDTGTLTDFGLINRLLSAIDLVEVIHLGTHVVSLRGDDLYALIHLWHGISIAQSNPVDTNNDRRSMVIPLLFGRRPWMMSECIPRTRRGELTLQITWDIADTGFDGLRISIEALELPEATPEWVQRVTTLTQTFAATGDNDIDLPIGNAIRGILMFGTTGFAGATPAATLADISVLRDNVQEGYSSTAFEVSRQISALTRRVPAWDEHLHSVLVATAGVRVDSERKDDLFPLMENYTLLDYDPTGDDEFVLETAGAGRIHLRIDADAADLVRVMPIERVPASAFGVGP